MNAQPSILIIEDDADINDVLATFLARHGFRCTQAYSGSEARLLLTAGGTSFPYDLVITDLMLPGASGEEIVRIIRSLSDAPIIVVSARETATDKVGLFGLGADDYLVKPFDLDELLARVTVQLRHSAKSRGSADASRGGAPNAIVYKRWTVDTESRTLAVDGEPVKLTRLEYNIVEALARRPKKVFTKQELYEAAWNEDCFVEEKAINVHISNVRGKLRESGTDGYIETVWGIGFKLAE